VTIIQPTVTVTATKTASDLTHPGATTALPGDVIRYTVMVSNNSTMAPAVNLLVTDNLTGPQTFQPGSCNPSCSSTGNPVVGTRFNLAPAGQQGSTATGTFNVTIDPGATPGTVINNTFQVSGDNVATTTSTPTTLTVGTAAPPPPGPATVSATKGVANLSAGQTSPTTQTSTTAQPGQTLEYSINVRNTSTNTATGLLVTDTLSAGQTFIGCGASTPGCTATVNPDGTTTVTGTVFNVNSGDTARGVFDVRGNPGFSGTLTNVFQVSGTNITTTSSNPTTVTVAAPTPTPTPTTLSLQKLVRDATLGGAFGQTTQARPGDTLQYQITATSASGTVNNVTVTDVLQSGQTMNMGTCGCAQSGSNVYTFNVGNVTAGSPVSFTFSVTTPSGTGTIYNTASAVSSNAPAVNSNTTQTYVSQPQPVVYPPIYYPPSYGNGNVCTYPSFTNCVFGNVYATSLTICGTVTAFSAATGSGVGTLTMNGETFLLAQNTTYTGQTLSIGLSFCVTFRLVSNGLINAVAASPNLAGTNYVCGVVSPFTNGYYPYANYAPNGYQPYAGYNPYYSGTTMGPYAMNGQYNGYYGYNGPMVIGGYPFQVSSSTAFPFTIGYNTSYCFLLNNSGSVSGSLSVIPTAAHTIDLPSGMRHGRANGTD